MTTPSLAQPETQDVVVVPYASWGRRLCAAFLDDAVLAAITWLALGEDVVPPSLQPVYETVETVEADGPQSWASSVVLVVLLLAALALQGRTGQTPGKRVMGIQLVRAPVGGPVGGPPGVGRSVQRWFAHMLDAIALIGYLRPLWHAERRTVADSLVGTVVLRTPPEPRGTWRGRPLTVAAAVVVLAGLVLGTPLGTVGGLDVGDDVVCALESRDAGADVVVQEAVLSRETQWQRPMRLLPWVRTGAREESSHVWLTLSWTVPATVRDDDVLVLRTTTSTGWTADGDLPLAEGRAVLSLQRVGTQPFDLTFLRDDRVVATCSATVPPFAGVGRGA